MWVAGRTIRKTEGFHTGNGLRNRRFITGSKTGVAKFTEYENVGLGGIITDAIRAVRLCEVVPEKIPVLPSLSQIQGQVGQLETVRFISEIESGKSMREVISGKANFRIHASALEVGVHPVEKFTGGGSGGILFTALEEVGPICSHTQGAAKEKRGFPWSGRLCTVESAVNQVRDQ
ncbi:MAG: hypothetical protein O7E57_01455 [Gammaproteobacteria bacterium]|nr:hypothetical protein [Gammaproteobacteria bacterium]